MITTGGHPGQVSETSSDNNNRKLSVVIHTCNPVAGRRPEEKQTGCVLMMRQEGVEGMAKQRDKT
jgi:hypothetical protein